MYIEDFKFAVLDCVYDHTRKLNGVVHCRKYQEEAHITFHVYLVCYQLPEGKREFEWCPAKHLELGYSTIID